VVATMAQNSAHPAVILVMVGILPRIFSILNSTYSFFLSSIGFPARYIQLKNIIQAFDLQKNINLLDRVQIDAIQITCDGEKSDLAQLEAACEASKPGRWCLKGPNGVGKSTLLFWIKERLGENCFLLPTAHQLTLESTRWKQPASSGQRMSQILQELLTIPSTPILLLDEWDASLDPQTQLAIHHLMSEQSKEKLIIEVRHHSSFF